MASSLARGSQVLLFRKQAGIFNGDPRLTGNRLHQFKIVIIKGILLWLWMSKTPVMLPFVRIDTTSSDRVRLPPIQI
ncbi:MAG: hypothetical protein ACM3XO_06645 [Bacteroidota bacterium]